MAVMEFAVDMSKEDTLKALDRIMMNNSDMKAKNFHRSDPLITGGIEKDGSFWIQKALPCKGMLRLSLRDFRGQVYEENGRTVIKGKFKMRSLRLAAILYGIFGVIPMLLGLYRPELLFLTAFGMMLLIMTLVVNAIELHAEKSLAEETIIEILGDLKHMQYRYLNGENINIYL